MEIFSKKLEEKGERFILDNYLPKDGTYILINMDKEPWEIEPPIFISYNKKTNEMEGKNAPRYPYLCCLDYYSNLITMNKAVDKNKIIHSNNYLSLFGKKESIGEGKLTEEVLDDYFSVLRQPELKYKKGNAKKLYQSTEKEFGEVNIKRLNEIQQWIKEHLSQLNAFNDGKKNYLKLFFVYSDEELTRELFQAEGKRYSGPNIFNSNDFNMEIDGVIYGLPGNNMNMNAKKPYLGNKSRKVQVPWLIDQNQAFLQNQFFDYLAGLASKGYYNIYFDYDDMSIIPCRNGECPGKITNGYFLRIRSGKTEVEIHGADTVVGFNPHLDPPFHYTKEKDGDIELQHVTTKGQLEALIDDIIFNKSLRGNYFTAPSDLNIMDNAIKNQMLKARDRLFCWFYRADGTGIFAVLEESAYCMAKNSALKGNFIKADAQIKFGGQLVDYFNNNHVQEETMSELKEKMREYVNTKEGCDLRNDAEYYYAVGQLLRYFIWKSKAYKKTYSMMNSFIDAKDDFEIKQHLAQIFRKYDYDISVSDNRFSTLFSAVMEYEPSGKTDKWKLLAGLTGKNMILEKKEELEKKESNYMAEGGQ